MTLKMLKEEAVNIYLSIASDLEEDHDIDDALDCVGDRMYDAFGQSGQYGFLRWREFLYPILQKYY